MSDIKAGALSLATLQGIRKASGSRALDEFVASQKKGADPGPDGPKGPGKKKVFVGQVVRNAAGTFFLVDLQGDKIIARGFSEGDTYAALHGTTAPALLPDRAFLGFDGYQPVASGSSLARVYGSDTVWFVDGARARGITSAEAFERYRFSWERIQTWSQEAMDCLSQDPDLNISLSDRFFEYDS